MKTLIGFLAGILVAGGIAFWAVQRKSEAPPAVSTGQVPAPSAQVVEEPKPAEPTPAAVEPPVKRPETAVKRSPMPVRESAKPRRQEAAAASPAPHRSETPETEVARNQETPAPPPAPEPPPYHEAPPPPPKPNTVTVPAGTILNVRLQEALSSDKNQVGDAFSAVLDKPLVVDGFVLAERGARVEGRVVTSQAAGRVRGVSSFAIELLSVRTADGQTLKLATETWEKQGETSKGSDAAKVGAAAGIGAAIGAIAGGGRGAAIGAAIGGGAGTGGVLATRGKAVKIPVETRIPFKLRESVTVTEKL